MSTHPLSNPVWHGLVGPHAHLGLGAGKVRRYRADIAMFVAVEDPRDPDMPGLHELVADGTAGFITEDPVSVPPGLEVLRIADVQHMQPLGEADEDAMLELTELTRPGPFFRKTRLMGTYRGLYASGRLVAMSGERMRTDAHTEVSAVCTHPDHRGRGYAKQFVSQGGNEIVASGKTPFLHTYADNEVAIATYEKLGFRRSRMMQFTVIRRG
jgi:GNAT superfamily N-acetyltransferase